MRHVPALLALLLMTAPACKPLLYPAARAFGSPAESYLKDCRAAFERLQAGRSTLRLVVHPAADPRRPQAYPGTAEQAVARLRNAGWARCEAATDPPPVASTPLGHNQLRYLWTRARAYRQWAAAEHPAGEALLCLEVFAGPTGEIAGAHLYVIEPSGQVAYVRLMNSHHFGPHPPAGAGEAVALLVKAFLRDLQRRSDEVFPPYGVG